jgi:soluble lytic murein transglycosylase
MIGHGDTRGCRWGLVAALLWCPLASAQSPALLDAVRVHKAGVVDLARQELAACPRGRCPTHERLTLLTAVLELSAGDAATAAGRLSSTPAPAGLEAFHAWYLGEALAWAGRPTEATGPLEKALEAAPAWMTPQVQARLGELWLEVGKPETARPLLEAAAEALKRPPEVLYPLALTLRALKQRGPATAALEQLALRHPLHPHGALAQAQLEADGAWRPGFEQRLRRAQAFLDAGAPARCLEELEGLPLPKGKAATGASLRLALLRGQALLARGREHDDEARAQLAIAATGPAATAAPALFALGRRLMRLQDNAGAREAFRTLDEKYPTTPNAEEGAYLAAWLAMNAGDFDTAEREFAEFEQRHARSRRRDEARWFRGFTLIRAKRHLDARELLLSLPRDLPRSSLVPQARYWAARCASLAAAGADAGPAADVVAEYQAVLQGFPGTFYALLSAERLLELGVDARLPFEVAPKSLAVKRPAALDLAAALAETGLFRDAAREVAVAIQQAGPGDALTWGHALQALGEFNAAHALAARHLWGAVYSQRAPEALALMYPRAFRASVEAWSEQHGLEPALAWAIMRRESAFASDVTSAADARGLMQIIPPTARAIARELGVPAPDPAELYAPDTNVRFGTWYLRALLERLGHPTLVAGAYNGGPSAVARWARERGELPLDQWIEEIPFKETRGYVKQVTADLFIYRQLYGGKAERLAMSVPTPSASGVDF